MFLWGSKLTPMTHMELKLSLPDTLLLHTTLQKTNFSCFFFVWSRLSGKWLQLTLCCFGFVVLLMNGATACEHVGVGWQWYLFDWSWRGRDKRWLSVDWSSTTAVYLWCCLRDWSRWKNLPRVICMQTTNPLCSLCHVLFPLFLSLCTVSFTYERTHFIFLCH